MQVRREERIINDIHAYRYCGIAPKYALIVSHGLGAHGGIYDAFCYHHSRSGVDVWSLDAPGHGQSTPKQPRGKFTLKEWVNASIEYSEYVQQTTGLPVFTLGASLGSAAAYSSLYSNAVSGSILTGAPIVPGGPIVVMHAHIWQSPDVQAMLEELGPAARIDTGMLFNIDRDCLAAGLTQKQHPQDTWSYDMASWASVFTYQAENPITKNRKPILVASGEKDSSYPPAMVRGTAEAIAGPVEYYMLENGGHELLLFHVEEISNKIEAWVSSHL